MWRLATVCKKKNSLSSSSGHLQWLVKHLKKKWRIMWFWLQKWSIRISRETVRWVQFSTELPGSLNTNKIPVIFLQYSLCAFLNCIIDIFVDNNTVVVQKRSFLVAVWQNIHTARQWLHVYKITFFFCYFWSGSIFNVDFLEFNDILGFPKNLTTT